MAEPTADVFSSYAHADSTWVETLAQNLRRLGCRPQLDRWALPDALPEGRRPSGRPTNAGPAAAPGTHAATMRGRNASETALRRPWVAWEFAALQDRSVAAGGPNRCQKRANVSQSAASGARPRPFEPRGGHGHASFRRRRHRPPAPRARSGLRA